MFKSYYVVWKLRPGCGVGRKTAVFKSYYVVWKQYNKNKINKTR